MKKLLILTMVGLFAFMLNGQAQEEGKFRVGLDLGYTIPSAGGGGILFGLEPKYNIKDNMNVGFRIAGAAMFRDLVIYNDTDASAKIAANASYSVTYDYYFKKEGSNFAPFVGGGIGWIRFASVEVDTTIDDDFEGLSNNSTIAPFLRGGFEAGKFRLSLEYNIVPKSDLVNTQGQVIGETSNSYLGIAIGFYVGGGKWRN
jgi:hypothetical protein